MNNKKWFDNSNTVYKKIQKLLHCLQTSIKSVVLYKDKIVININDLSDEFVNVDNEGWINYKKHYTN